MVRKILLGILLITSARAQCLPVWPGYPNAAWAQPSVIATLTNNVVTFTCNNLAGVSQFAYTSCPGPVTIPEISTVYFGLTAGGLLHVSNGDASPNAAVFTCSHCVQDIFMFPAPGEYRIGVCASTCVSTWTTFPALPLLVLPVGCSALQSPTQVVVTCTNFTENEEKI